MAELPPPHAESVFDVVYEYLLVDGIVPEWFDPHLLTHSRVKLSRYMECHVKPNVLLVYKVTKYHQILL
ncbi:type II toxin-antitoxin system YafQ family toxin [Bifidobacterium simiarum]|nr:type II toxin-antitoxin system YafQ family toxin [Bifidobacterium simiarum]